MYCACLHTFIQKPQQHLVSPKAAGFDARLCLCGLQRKSTSCCYLTEPSTASMRTRTPPNDDGTCRSCTGNQYSSCAVLCCVVLCCVVLCCAVLWCAVLCCSVLCCGVVCCAVLSCAVLCCVVLCCAVVCCAVVCCAVHHR